MNRTTYPRAYEGITAENIDQGDLLRYMQNYIVDEVNRRPHDATPTKALVDIAVKIFQGVPRTQLEELLYDCKEMFTEYCGGDDYEPSTYAGADSEASAYWEPPYIGEVR